MDKPYTKFSSLAFLGKPKRHILTGGWVVEYLSFCLPEHQGKPPVVFLGGAFQTFFSFKKDVQVMMEEHPIMLVDLPSQGSNSQLSESLSFKDYARLLHEFTMDLGLNKINPIGLSYGSATAFYFASLYPERTHKLVLGGTTTRVRDSYRALLQDTFGLLDSGEMSIFSQGAVMNLINYSKRHITKIPERVIKGFYKNMMSLSSNDQLRYKHNTQRLLNLSGVEGNPQCPTLVLTGEYDNFTTPHENYEMSKLLVNSSFILIKEADHLANLEKRDVVIQSYLHFLREEDLSLVEGIDVMNEKKMEALERRLEPRLVPSESNAALIDASENRYHCTLLDINANGCQLHLHGASLEELDLSKYVSLEICDCPELELTAHVLNRDLICLEDGTPIVNLSCIFRRGDFEQGLKLEIYVDSLEPKQSALA
jgi:pimeloyl-ACP methyl ester carboxylesterase